MDVMRTNSSCSRRSNCEACSPNTPLTADAPPTPEQIAVAAPTESRGVTSPTESPAANAAPTEKHADDAQPAQSRCRKSKAARKSKSTASPLKGIMSAKKVVNNLQEPSENDDANDSDKENIPTLLSFNKNTKANNTDATATVLGETCPPMKVGAVLSEWNALNMQLKHHHLAKAVGNVDSEAVVTSKVAAVVVSDKSNSKRTKSESARLGQCTPSKSSMMSKGKQRATTVTPMHDHVRHFAITKSTATSTPLYDSTVAEHGNDLDTVGSRSRGAVTGSRSRLGDREAVESPAIPDGCFTGRCLHRDGNRLGESRL